jgi:predicted DNA binding CopG/RHH family protein
MSATSKSKSRLPPGLSPAEEARWWDEHQDYWNETESSDEQTVVLPARPTKPVNLRLPVDMIDDLKRAAVRRALPYQTLIRMWLKERLDSEPREVPSPDRTAHC